MPKIDQFTPLHPDTPMVDGALNGYHLQYLQTVTNLGKYVVENQIGSIVTITYPFSNTSLGNKLEAKVLTNVFDRDINGVTFQVTAANAELGVEGFPTLRLCDFVTKQANPSLLKYDLLFALLENFLGSGVGNPSYPGNCKSFYLVTIKGKTYLGLHEDGSSVLELLHFVTLPALVNFFRKFEASDLYQDEFYDEGGDLSYLLGGSSTFGRITPVSWSKPTPIDPTFFTTPTPVISEFNPFLVGDAWMTMPGYGLDIEDMITDLMPPELVHEWVPAIQKLWGKLDLEAAEESSDSAPTSLVYTDHRVLSIQPLWSEKALTFTTQLCKFLVENKIGAVLSSTYGVKSGGYLGKLVKTENWFDLFAGDPHNNFAFAFTGLIYGLDFEAKTAIEKAQLLSTIPEPSHYDLLQGVCTQFFHLEDDSDTVDLPLRVVSLNGSYYLSSFTWGDSGKEQLTLFSFIPLSRLRSLYSSGIEVCEYMESWYAPTPIPLSVFEADVSITSGYNPILFWASTDNIGFENTSILGAAAQACVGQLPPHLQGKMTRAILAQGRYLGSLMVNSVGGV